MARVTACLRCGTGLENSTGVYAFVAGAIHPGRVDVLSDSEGLFCIDCGSNGHNIVTKEEAAELRAAAKERKGK